MATSRQMSQDVDQSLKILLIGDSTVGKSSLLTRFCESTFNKTYVSTIGIDFKVRYMDLNGKKIKVQVWDTAGQERFLSITKRFYRGAQGILVAFDLTRFDSFHSVPEWFKIIEAETEKSNVPVVLVGNKVDLTELRLIDREDAAKVAVSLKVPYFETSALSGENVEIAFTQLINNILDNAKSAPSNRPDPSLIQADDSTQKPSLCTC